MIDSTTKEKGGFGGKGTIFFKRFEGGYRMRIITPTGDICKVCNVEFMVEKQEIFNKKVCINREIAADMSVKPTGLKCYIVYNQNDFSTPYVYIGNLAFEKVREIQKALLEKGFYDFSVLEYQKTSLLEPQKLVIDGGKSLPFYENFLSKGMFSCPSNTWGMPMPDNSIFENEGLEECGEDEDEGLDEDCKDGE